MKTEKLLLIGVMALCLSLVLIAQTSPTEQRLNPQNPSDADDRLEGAHAPIFSPPNTAKDASRLTEAAASSLPANPASYAPVPRKNFIDEFIFGKMERDKIPHAPLSSDAEFLRRAYLDATGLLPSVDQARAFLNDRDPNKRDKLIDSIVGTEAFADQFAYHYGELFRVDNPQFALFLKENLLADRPYNEMFYDIVTPVTKVAAGIPTAQFYDAAAYISNKCVIWQDADHLKGFNRLDWIDEVTSDIGRVFLGITMDCFSCHNGAGHTDSFNLFLTRMKRTDFWQQAAFFGNMRAVGNATNSAGAQFQNGNSLFDDLAPGYNTGNDGNYITVAENRFARDGRTYQPAFFLTGEKPKPGETARKALGRILPSNIQFARAAVNLMWKKLMVVGLVEPYDGFDLDRLDPKNPPKAPWTLQPTNPELLQAMAEDFRANNFSLQHVIKTIMKSNAYQLSTSFEGEWKDAYIAYHARKFARILTGPEATDVVAQATDVPLQGQQFGKKLKYVKEFTTPSSAGRDLGGFMAAYYQGGREMPPIDKTMATPLQAMMMMASPVVTQRVEADKDTRVAGLAKSNKSEEEMIQELFLASVSRFPGAEEVELAKRVLAEKGKQKGLEHIQWALLNTPEFLLNH
jgi:Protein of unknown function (DUF1549)/Protein of unknown function (DUF1553)